MNQTSSLFSEHPALCSQHSLIPCTEEERTLLAQAGLVHVTGLHVWRDGSDGGLIDHLVGPLRNKCAAGKKHVLVVTYGREVWFGMVPVPGSESEKNLRLALARACENGTLSDIGFDPDNCEFDVGHLQERRADPYCVTRELVSAK